MSTEPERVDRRFYVRWVRATSLGWLLGFGLVIVLAMAWNLVGGGAQFMVGVGMGAGVGYMQSRMIGEWVDSTRPWMWASVVGMGVPFVLWDIGAMVGMNSLFSLPLCVVLGGLLVGLMQRRLLASRSDRAYRWVPACAAGWALPAGAIALGDSVSGGWGGLVSLAAMLMGGAVLGLVTGGALIWLRPRPVA